MEDVSVCTSLEVRVVSDYSYKLDPMELLLGNLAAVGTTVVGTGGTHNSLSHPALEECPEIRVT